MASKKPQALLFDVFGTCVDWRSTVTAGLAAQAHATLNSVTASLASTVRLRASSMTSADWGDFAQQWRNSYKQFTVSLAQDPTLPWKTIDEHHREALEKLLVERQLDGLWTDEEVGALTLLWHRLDPWPDSSPGLAALNRVVGCTATLSNGNLSLLEDLKAHARIDFTHVFSAEMFGSYKPSAKVYLGAVEKLGLQPGECAMVAAHLADLKAAKSLGLQAIYVERPLEEDWSREQMEAARREGWVDVWITAGHTGFVSLAELLA